MSIYDKASLVLIPSGTKTSKVYSQKPVSGDGDFTFSRSTAATRVNADGLIEKETNNKFIYSNNFNSGWSPKAGTFTQGVADPNGGSTAWSWTALNTDPYLYQYWSLSGVHCVSIWAKGVGSTIGHTIEIRIGASINYFTLTSEWQRFESFAVLSGSNNIGFEFGNPTATAGDVIHIYGAQLEDGLVARDYIETTTTAVEGGITDNVPRLDYTDSSCPALLLEPQRTNNAPYSEYQSGGGFSLGTNITWNGFVESPEGVNNASRFTSNAASSSFVQIPNTTIPAGDFTFSMWVRGVSGSFVNRSMYIPSHTGTQATMNEAPVAGEDWKLVYGSGTNTSGSSYSRPITLPFYDQPVGAVWEMYGFQLESGTYNTSYIPTYGSAVTRNRDEASTSSSVTLATKNFTIFVDSKKMNLASAGSLQIGYKTGGSAVFMFGNCIGYAGSTGNEYYCAGTLLGDCKWAFVADYDAGYIKVFLNGQLKKTDTSFNLSKYGLGQVKLNYSNAMAQYENVMTFPTALSDEECIDLTTL